jgi:hypothetical protein
MCNCPLTLALLHPAGVPRASSRWGWPRGGVVTQRTANPRTRVRFSAWPPFFSTPANSTHFAGGYATKHSLFTVLPVARASFSQHGATFICPMETTWLKRLARLAEAVYRVPARFAAPFPGSSVVEQSTVNRSVVGSNPTQGASFGPTSRILHPHRQVWFSAIESDCRLPV